MLKVADYPSRAHEIHREIKERIFKETIVDSKNKGNERERYYYPVIILINYNLIFMRITVVMGKYSSFRYFEG
jgi:RPA family protein